MALRLRWGKATDVGRVRSHNEDSSLVNDLVFAVADGMGGHRGGAVASQMALDSLEASFTEPTSEALVAAAYDANEAVFERSNDDPELRGMGTTLVAIAPVDEEDPDSELVAWVHVGDSRIYLYRDDELQQLTEDHSLVEQWVREGTISAEEARSHPQRNILTRALGIGSEVGIDAGTVIPYAGDRFVLCSDGLFNEVDEPRIEATLRRLADPEDASQELVRQAVENGGRDNITVIVIEVVNDDDAAATASAAVRTTTVEGHADRPIAKASKAPRKTRKERRKARGARPRRVTWRVLLFVLLFLAILAGGAAVIGYQARNTYYVGFKGDSVVVFRGKPGGMLWFKPTFEQDTGLTRAQIPQSEIDRITNGQEESTVSDADAYVQSIRDRTTTTTSTTTTPPTTSIVTTTVPVVATSTT